MRRLLAICAVLVAAGALAVVGTGAGTKDKSTYEVRAIFRNAFSVIPGEDVKIAGVKVGKIKSLDVTPQQTAAVVLDITNPGFQDFRKDAECTIRPQSLIGEKFVECVPTQPRPAGAQPAPKLEKIRSGPGKGQFLLPVDRTRRPVDIDLVANIMRLPYRERFTILLNEFGAGLAGRGGDLKQIIRNADPGLAQTDRVLKILGDQNEVLAKLAEDSDTVLAPLARQREQVAGFVDKASTVSVATAEKSKALEASLQRLPAFLRQLTPTMQRLGSLSDQATPVLADLGAQAPSINRLIEQMGPFSRAATPSLQTLGEASVPGRKALLKAKPIIGDLKDFAAEAQPLSANLKALLTSFKDSGGVERLMDYIFYQATAVNGFDAYGHYLRAQLIVNLCSVYATKPDPACSAKFTGSGASSRSAEAALADKGAGRSPALARTEAVLRGMSPDEVLGRRSEKDRKGAKHSGGDEAPALKLPPALLPGGPDAGAAPAPAGESGPASGQQAAPAPAPQSDQQSGGNAVGALLDYLLGG